MEKQQYIEFKQKKLQYLSTYADPTIQSTCLEDRAGVRAKKTAMPHATIMEREKPQKLRHSRVNDQDSCLRHGKTFERSKGLLCNLLASNPHEEHLV